MLNSVQPRVFYFGKLYVHNLLHKELNGLVNITSSHHVKDHVIHYNFLKVLHKVNSFLEPLFIGGTFEEYQYFLIF